MWDSRYAGSALVWSSGPNAVVARETAELPPGRAVDLASGEGRNAIWLASRGWRVTAIDFSSVATERTVRLAADRLGGEAKRLTAITADLLAWEPEADTENLAVLAYLQLPAAERRAVHRKAAACLGPGGTFLLVAHHLDNLTQGVGGPQDAEVLFTESDVRTDLEGTGLVVERAARVEREVVAEGAETHGSHMHQPSDEAARPAVALDVLVRARRLA